MLNPLYDPYQVLTKVYAAGAHLKLALAETPIEEAHRPRTVKVCYGVLEHDAYLAACIRSVAEKNPKQSVRILLKIALYFLIFLEKPRYMVTDLAVELLKKMGKGGMAGFVNAALRKFDADRVPIPEGDEGLALTTPYPLFAVKKLRAEYGARTESIVRAKSGGVSVRFERGEEDHLTRPHTPTPFAHLFLFEHFPRDERFFAGDYTFQSVGSVAICGVVEGCARLLDACAAPGGKSVLLSKKCGLVTSEELYPHRAELIQSYARRMGAKNISVTVGDASVFNPEFEGRFDCVLCDVPCSGTGVINENPDIKLFRREEDIASLTALQQKILSNCARYVKEGGRLYYSTCSILPEENDSAAFGFISSNPQFTLEIPECALPSRRTKFGLQFLPNISLGAGFYVTSFQRKG